MITTTRPVQSKRLARSSESAEDILTSLFWFLLRQDRRISLARKVRLNETISSNQARSEDTGGSKQRKVEGDLTPTCLLERKSYASGWSKLPLSYSVDPTTVGPLTRHFVYAPFSILTTLVHHHWNIRDATSETTPALRRPVRTSEKMVPALSMQPASQK